MVSHAIAAARRAPQPPPIWPLNWTMISVLIVVGLQLAGVVAWGATANSRLATLERNQAPLADGRLLEQVGRIDERTKAVKDDFDQLRADVQALRRSADSSR